MNQSPVEWRQDRSVLRDLRASPAWHVLLKHLDGHVQNQLAKFRGAPKDPHMDAYERGVYGGLLLVRELPDTVIALVDHMDPSHARE